MKLKNRYKVIGFVFLVTHTSMFSFSEFCIGNDLIEDSKSS